MTGQEKICLQRAVAAEGPEDRGNRGACGMMGPAAQRRLWAGEKSPTSRIDDDHRYDAFSCMGHPVVKTTT